MLGFLWANLLDWRSWLGALGYRLQGEQAAPLFLGCTAAVLAQARGLRPAGAVLCGWLVAFLIAHLGNVWIYSKAQAGMHTRGGDGPRRRRAPPAPPPPPPG